MHMPSRFCVRQTKITFNRAQFPDCPQLFGSTFPFNIVGYNDQPESGLAESRD